MFLPGQYNLDQILEIRKAFEANSAQGGATPFLDTSSGAALSMQSLDKTFVALVSTDKDFNFLSQIPKRGTKQVLAEYNKQKSHGGGWYQSSFIGQSDEPSYRDAVLKRLWDEVCYVGEGFDFNKVVDTVDNVQDPSLTQGNSALKRSMENLTRSAWFGKKSVNRLTHNGFEEKCRAASSDFVIDSRGQLPSAEEIKHYSAQVRTNYFGVVNDAWMHNNTKALYDQYYDGNNRSFVYQNNSQNPGNVGLSNVITGMYDSNAKDEYIRFKTDIFMDRHQWTVPKRYDHTADQMVEGPTDLVRSPDVPALAVSAQTTVPGSKFSASDAGVYKYRVSSGEAIHWSQACVAAPATVAAAGAVEITITPAGTGSPASRFAIFRSIKPGSDDIRYMVEISRNTSGPDTVYLDKNDDLPGTTIMVVGDFNSRSTVDEARTCVLTELLPFTKTLFPYGAGGKLRMRLGMVEWYGVLQIMAEEKFRVFKNVPVRL